MNFSKLLVQPGPKNPTNLRTLDTTYTLTGDIQHYDIQDDTLEYTFHRGCYCQDIFWLEDPYKPYMSCWCFRWWVEKHSKMTPKIRAQFQYLSPPWQQSCTTSVRKEVESQVRPCSQPGFVLLIHHVEFLD